MTLFLLFLVVVFFGGIVLRNLSAGQRALLVILASVALAFLYFTLERFI